MEKAGTDKTIQNRLLTGFGRVLSFSALLLTAYSLRPMALNAEVPVKFTYQGNLRQAGFLVNGQRGIVFRIYDSSTSVTELWTSPAYNVQFSTGVFRVVLEPALSDWQTGALWLELEIEGNRMSPREELTSSPYSINSLMVSGKKYTTASSAPIGPGLGDLWMDNVTGTLKFWNGSVWMLTSGTGIPGVHAFTHTGIGSDPILNLGAHSVSGALTFDNSGEIRASGGVSGITIATHTVIGGVLNPASNLLVGGAGYSVSLASSVTAGWYYGDGSGLANLNASQVKLGSLSGDRIGNVLVSTHIVDGSIQNQDLADGSVTRGKLNQSGCANGQILKWDSVPAGWVCAADSVGGGGEIDPVSIHNQDVLQAGTTFYVSSGTVNDLNVNNSLKVNGTARLLGAPGQVGLSVEATGNVGIGMAGAAARLEIKGVDTQNYSLAVGTGTAQQVVVSTSGSVGIGTENPAARLDVTGAGVSGEYIVIFNSGAKTAAWLRNK